MKTRVIGNAILYLCLVAFGVFLGIWADWSEWLSGPVSLVVPGTSLKTPPGLGGRDLEYVVDNYGSANLVVYKTDVIHLQQPGGSTGATMNFLGGYSPCAEGNNTSTCTLDGSKPLGPFFFSCSSKNGYTCPDPAIQQAPSSGPGKVIWIPTPAPTLGVAGGKDVAHAFGAPRFADSTQPAAATSPGGSPGSGGPNGGATVSGIKPVAGYVVCNASGKTEVDQLNANDPPPDSSIAVAKGDLLTWVSPSPFTLTWKSSGLCGATNPGGVSTNKTQCAVTGAPGAYHYTATSSVSGCAVSVAETIVVTN
jgi:hypothetical protein